MTVSEQTSQLLSSVSKCVNDCVTTTSGFLRVACGDFKLSFSPAVTQTA